MQKSVVLLIFLLVGGMCVNGQDLGSQPLVMPSKKHAAPSKFKSINIPARKYGISIGNSTEFNGLRINLADKDVKRVNGVNVTFWAKSTQSLRKNQQNYKSAVNGVSVGTIPTGGSLNGINAGVLRVASMNNMNGLSVSGLNISSLGNINGLSVSGLLTQFDGFSGIGISGIALAGTGYIDGLAIGGLVVSSDRSDINGVAATLGVLYCGNDFTGVGISGIYLKSGVFKGVSVSGYSNSNKMYGFSGAVFNRTRELHGVQIGLLNYAGNNRKGLRYLPFINMHLKKN